MPITGTRLFLLKHCRVWQELDAEARQRLEGAGKRERHPRGGLVWRPDDDPGEAQLILEGRARVHVFDELGREVVLGVVEEGELAAQEETTASDSGYVEALESCELIRLRLTELQSILEEEATEIAGALREARGSDLRRG